MKLLIVGDGKSQFVANFASYLKLYYPHVSLDILNVNSTTHVNELQQISGNSYNRVFNYNTALPYIGTIPKVRGVLRLLRQQIVKREVKLNKYDVVCIHGLFKYQIEILKWVPDVSKFVVGVFWGSDLFKRNETLVGDSLQIALNKLDRLSVATKEMKEEVLKNFSFPESNLRNCLFGLKPLDLLNESGDISSADAKSQMRVDVNTFVITCGYNGHVYQQHLEIIDSLVLVKEYLPENYLLLFPVTYGASTQYINKLVEKLDATRMNYQLIINFLTDSQVVFLRKATDLFIQLQRTDAFSGSMQEHLYCQNVVITGAWLPYQHMIDKGIAFEQIENLDQLPAKLRHILTHWHEKKVLVTQANTPDKFKSSLWSNCIHDWYKVLNEYQSV